MCFREVFFHTFGLTNSITEIAISSEKFSFKIFCISYFNNHLIIGIFLVFIKKHLIHLIFWLFFVLKMVLIIFLGSGVEFIYV